MEKGKLRVSPKLIALLVAGGIALSPVPGSCLTNNSYDEGTFVRWVEEDDAFDYGLYVVMENDNWSRISEKVCSHHRVEITTKYWPALVYMNGCPKVIKPGDIIIFPKEQEKLEELNDKLQKSGWTSKYKQTHKVYGEKKPKKKISMNEVSRILSDCYGPDVCIDPDFVVLYLKATGLDDDYILTMDDKMDNDTYFALTDWIPTLEELNEYREAHKPKTKTK